MSAPTGEVLNYETAIAEIDAEIEEVQKQVDSAQAAKASLAEAKANVDAMQRNYQATAQAAQSKLDHEAALGLDSTTLGHAGTTVDALPPNAVDALYEQIESMEAEVGDRLKQSETALGSLEAERKHLVETYGEEAGKVASHLGGDPTFLGSGGQTSTPNQPEPVGASR